MPLCPICQKENQEELVYPADVVVTTEIRSQNPTWKEADGVCATCVAEYEKRLQG